MVMFMKSGYMFSIRNGLKIGMVDGFYGIRLNRLNRDVGFGVLRFWI